MSKAGLNKEWIVADHRGAFAMGTPEGIRTRKYHGFFMGIPGRSETAFLSDLEFEWNGLSLWPHCYSSPQGPLIFPQVDPSVVGGAQLTQEGPEWSWTLPHGSPESSLETDPEKYKGKPPNNLKKRGKSSPKSRIERAVAGTAKFKVRACDPGGISLSWKWSSKKKAVSHLSVRAFWAMRDLHGMGGNVWRWTPVEGNQSNRFCVIRESAVESTRENKPKVFCFLKGNWIWRDDPKWYQNFHYSEEVARGYRSDENLYSAGILEITLESGEIGEWIVAEDSNDLPLNITNHSPTPLVSDWASLEKSRVSDFILTRPAGLVAGFPWFGEWGRDTFISLPGVAIALLKPHGKNANQLWIWVRELLQRWGGWIERKGMLPNLIEKDGICQWESADATLWWCHSLATLWAFSLSPPYPFSELQREFKSLLSLAIVSIKEGRHHFLKETNDGLLEVTHPGSTWMDAQADGKPITPRVGKLPEINALWYEACCLQWLWSEETSEIRKDANHLKEMGGRVLQCREDDRPNTIFHHSLALAPSFVLGNWEILERDMMDIGEKFWSPVGLKTLKAGHPAFQPHCIGTQWERDHRYHQGVVWAWLGGQFEIAKDRYFASQSREISHSLSALPEKMLTPEIRDEMPVKGHISEIFDAEPPYTPRGAPAQAWSLACLEEARARKRLRTDAKISKILTRRWLGRKERQGT